ncbi:hypothetical protein [Streptomyces sp. NPDC091219]|uniref:hypothetical protein n=1 Tax=Streptomyces sp. NPDC091219 TaxID=3155193 RepID=UPI00344BDAFB
MGRWDRKRLTGYDLYDAAVQQAFITVARRIVAAIGSRTLGIPRTPTPPRPISRAAWARQRSPADEISALGGTGMVARTV